MYEHILSQKIKIGDILIKNRFVMPAMESGTTKNHFFTDRSVAYFLARAIGGFGLIITDYMAIAEDGIGIKDEAGLWDDKFIPSLKTLTDSIHTTETRIFSQLHHSGIMCQKEITEKDPRGPSVILSHSSNEFIKSYTEDEIKTLITQYGDAAFRAKKANFDGVEIHAAHGYQIAQFLSKYTNKRVDAYGGSYENRFRFAKEIIQTIREKCGENFPILFRISAEEFLEGGGTIQDAIIYSQMAEDAGVDAIHISTGTGIGGNIVTPHYFNPGFNIENAKKIKNTLHIPVIVVGRINDPILAASIVKNGYADMVALGRQSICDPAFPIKVQQRKENEIFHCTGCMQRCYYSSGCEENDIGVSCVLNPFSGKELSWKINPTLQPKKIVIVGAGPAGLEAAWILAKRGHQVTVFEREAEAGGHFRLAAIPPKKQDLAYAIYTYTQLCKKNGVTIHYNQEIDEQKLGKLQQDILILCTGAKPILPNIKGLHNHEVITADEILSGKKQCCNERILILGGGLVGCETAEYLHLYKNEITIVDMADSLAKESVKRSRIVLLQNLKEANTKVVLNTKIKEVLNNGIIAEQDNKDIKLDGFTRIVLALGYQSDNPLEKSAQALGIQTYVIGDAKKARDAKYAIYEGAKLGITL